MAFTVLGLGDARTENTQNPYHYAKSLMKKREFFPSNLLKYTFCFICIVYSYFPGFWWKKILQNFKRLDKQDDVGANRESHKQESPYCSPVGNSCTTLHSYQQCIRFPFLYILANVVISCVFFFFYKSHPNRCGIS